MYLPNESWVMPQLLKQIKIVINFNLISLEIHVTNPLNLKTQMRILLRDSKVPGYLSCHSSWTYIKSCSRVFCNFFSCVQVGAICRRSKDNGSLGIRNGWYLVLTWFMSGITIRKIKIKPSFEDRKSSTALEKTLYYTPCIPMSFSFNIYMHVNNI